MWVHIYYFAMIREVSHIKALLASNNVELQEFRFLNTKISHLQSFSHKSV